MNETYWAFLRRKDELMRDVILRTPTHGHTSVSRPTRTHIYQLCIDTGCRLEDRPTVMDDRDGW